MYTKLANSILTSTVWMESNETRIVWLTLLAMCDKNGEVQASIPGLANVARVTVQECETAIQLFLWPDPYSRTKSDEGRRLEEIDGGWFVINHDKYRDLASDSDVKRKAAERQRGYRERQKRNGESVTESVTSVTRCDKSRQIPHTDTDTKEETKTKTQPAADDSFDQFWQSYPRKVAKGTARKAWDKAVKTVDAQTIIDGGKRYAASMAGSESKFIAHPTSWLNAERWADEPEPAPKPEIKPGTPEWAARSIKWLEPVREWQAMANRGEITDAEFNRRVAEAAARPPE